MILQLSSSNIKDSAFTDLHRITVSAPEHSGARDCAFEWEVVESEAMHPPCKIACLMLQNGKMLKKDLRLNEIVMDLTCGVRLSCQHW
jgi:hypothetical protein